MAADESNLSPACGGLADEGVHVDSSVVGVEAGAHDRDRGGGGGMTLVLGFGSAGIVDGALKLLSYFSDPQWHASALEWPRHEAHSARETRASGSPPCGRRRISQSRRNQFRADVANLVGLQDAFHVEPAAR